MTSTPPESRPARVRLLEIAAQAGVSQATVSRLLSGKAVVSGGARQRILAAAQALGMDLESSRKDRVIAFLLSNRGVLHPFHSSVLVGAESYCADNDYALLFLSYTYATSLGARQLSLPALLQRRQMVAGVIAAGTNSPGLLQLLSRRGIPWVALGNNVVGERSREEAAVNTVFFDDAAGAAQLTRYLLGLGHRRIGFAGNRRFPWYARRQEGYRQAMAEAGLAAAGGEIHTGEGEEMGYLAAQLLLQAAPTPTAIIAGDDVAARGVYAAARERGLRIPEQLSVAGFNDGPEAAALHPPLTSVRVFTDELGRQMAKLLLARIARPDQPVASLMLPTQLIKRESCAPPPAAALAPARPRRRR